ncbi:hypothetical protein K8R03_04115 [Candidatus Kaiserbacteria bacterium]|nr:hypothetical protein [Candidatus Kaiserbacteria bacterium]
MVKDYFQDIIPPEQPHDIEPPRRVPVSPMSTSNSTMPPEPEISQEEPDLDPPSPDRSIRNVNINPSRPRRPMPEMTQQSDFVRKAPPHRIWLWVVAAVSVLALAILLLMALRATTVTVTPKTHAVIFDQTSQFTAYPSVAAASGTLPYTVQTVDLEDSDTVTSTGTVHSEEKASGSITVFNDFSSAPVKLIKTTRFETPDGLVFRAPADIVVPAKSGSTPGSVTVTVVADQVGDKYNVGPISRFTLPGLKSTPDMYAHVYASSNAAFTGGFSGDKPGVSQADTDTTVAAIRSRLEGKVRDAAKALENDSSIVFTDLVQVQYQDEPTTSEAGGKVRIHQKAHVLIPVFPADAFAAAVAQSVSSNTDNASMFIIPGEGYGAHMTSASSTLGVDPMSFTLIGNALIVWRVDTKALTEALAGKDQSAFQNIVTGFEGVQEARARIEPFWSSVFPKNAASIKVTVVNPAK